MRFAHPLWLLGTGLSVVVALMLVAGAFLLIRSVRRFGDENRVTSLMTDRPAGRRALKGVLLVIAVALGFVALAQPQYGRGTRLVPATNLDVVVALDYSKSMYARDVAPSRTERAKAEVARLIAELPGARFGAVAFAGEPISFPLTTDGGAIAQFFRQLTPMDMPIGGTAIARALEASLDLFRRDPLSARHKRVLVLVTDGEDLEGDPVAIANDASKERVTVHVVQIGGRTPEPIPEVTDNGNVTGWRKDSSGQPLTTSLSAEGEEQLTKIAQSTGGNAIRSERGSTGISEIAASMKTMMTEELSERVETVYADVYLYPTALAVFLLLVEALVPEARRKKARARGRSSATAIASAAVSIFLVTAGCQGGKPFQRHSPVVDDAIHALADGGDPGTAAELLETYLSTGKCEKGELGAPESVHAKPSASFDLGLALFRIASRFGGKFGDDKAPAPGQPDQSDKLGEEVDCALRVVRVVANDGSVPVELKAHAEYLSGNLEFLRGQYRDAVTAYDAALKLSPGNADKESVGSRASWNRAIALRRIEEEEKKKKPDSGTPPNKPDGGPEQQDGGSKDQPKQSPDGGAKKDDKNQNDDQKNQDKNKDKKDDSQKDKKDDSKDQKKDQQKQGPDSKNQNEGPQQQAKPPPASLSQDERMLDTLEQAQTVQQENAKRNAKKARILGMEDK
jgi:Ca-activated chloride channel family protein